MGHRPPGDVLDITNARGTPDATVSSSAHDVVLWGTVRSPWREHCEVSGDRLVATTFLGALNIV